MLMVNCRFICITSYVLQLSAGKYLAVRLLYQCFTRGFKLNNFTVTV